jgi:hypothetical protein
VNGVPEAVGVGVSKLVDINPAIGILVAILVIAIVFLSRELLKSLDRERKMAADHLASLELQVQNERKDREVYDRFIDKLEDRERGRGR